jgi:RimJ/RimL family protein N-acetyltransferase
MPVVPTLSDGVITLNAYADDDFAAHLAGEDEETARRFGWWPQRSTEARVRDAIDLWTREWAIGGPTRTFATREVASERLVGGCELRLRPDGSAHVSYWTGRSMRRHGYATRALRLLCQYATSIGVTRLECHVAEDNLASRRVSEKVGFSLTGSLTAEDGTAMARYEGTHLTC